MANEKAIIRMLKAENEELKVCNERLRKIISEIANTKMCKRCQAKIKFVIEYCLIGQPNK